MTNQTRLLAVGIVLAGLIVATIAVFAREPTGIGGPGQPVPPELEPLTAAPGQAEGHGAVDAEPETERTVEREQVTSTSTTGSLRIDVRWSDGSPAPGIAVTLRASVRGLPSRILGRLIAGDQGQILADGLPVGTVNLRSDRGGKKKVEIEAGRRVECEFVLPEGIAVSGRVTDRRDQPVAGASVWLQTEYTDWTAGRVITRTGNDGRFALQGIPTGLSLGAIADGFAPSPLIDLDTVDTSSPPVDVHLVVEDSAGVVEGRVVSNTGEPIAGALIAVGKPRNHMDHRRDGQWVEHWSVRTTESDEAGRFALHGLPTGTPPVAARAEGFGFWRGETEVKAGERSWLDVTLGRSATITGTVTDPNGAPLAMATLRAYDRAPRTPFVQGGQIDFDETFGHIAAHSDQEGRYQLTGVTPGEVHVFAQAPHKGGWAESVPYVTELVEAEPGAVVEWSPVISAGRTIEGVVLYHDGHPMSNVFITAKDEQGGPQHIMVNDEKGHFRFVCLEGASYSLHVQLWSPPKGTPPLEQAGIVPGHGSVQLRAGFPKPVEGPKGEVSGRIDDVGKRIPHQKALTVQLVSEKRWWRTHPEIVDSTFRFDNVEAGRYRVVALAGETAIAQRDWFDVAPAEVLDIGVLTTEPAGTLVIRLERPDDTQDMEPVIYLSREGWSRGSQIAMGRRSEARLELTPGSYKVTGYADGMTGLKDEVEVRVGEETELRLALQSAALVRVAIWFPEGRAPGKSTVKVVGADGVVLSSFDRTHGAVPPRPFEISRRVPPGQWSVAVTTDTGLSGTSRFSVDKVDAEYPVVRVDLQ